MFSDGWDTEYFNGAQYLTLQFTNPPQAPLTTLLIFHSAAVQGPRSGDPDFLSMAASQGPQCQPRAANSQLKSWQDSCFQQTLWQLLKPGSVALGLKCTVPVQRCPYHSQNIAVTQLPGGKDSCQCYLPGCSHTKPCHPSGNSPVPHSQGCPSPRLPRGPVPGPTQTDTRSPSFQPSRQDGERPRELGHMGGTAREAEAAPRVRRDAGSAPAPARCPVLGGGSALQYGGVAPGVAPARPHGPGTRAGPALPPPRRCPHGAPAAAGAARWASPVASRLGRGGLVTPLWRSAPHPRWRRRGAPGMPWVRERARGGGAARRARLSRRCHSAFRRGTSSRCGLRAAPRGSGMAAFPCGALGTAGRCSPALAEPLPERRAGSRTQRRGSAGPSRRTAPTARERRRVSPAAPGCGRAVQARAAESSRNKQRASPAAKILGTCVFKDCNALCGQPC